MPADELVVQLSTEFAIRVRGQCRKEDVFTGFMSHILGQKLIGDEYHGIGVERLYHRRRIARRAADIDFSFDIGVGVDVGDNRHTRESPSQLPHVVGRDALGQRAAGLFRGKQNGFLRIEYFRRFCHKPHAAEYDDVPVRLRRFSTEHQRIAGVVRDGVKQCRFHVVMPQNHGVLLFFKTFDFTGQLGFVAQFKVWNNVA